MKNQVKTILDLKELSFAQTHIYLQPDGVNL